MGGRVAAEDWARQTKDAKAHVSSTMASIVMDEAREVEAPTLYG